jgi:ABC-type uncharacterized transport system ATPase subunit
MWLVHNSQGSDSVVQSDCRVSTVQSARIKSDITNKEKANDNLQIIKLYDNQQRQAECLSHEQIIPQPVMKYPTFIVPEL